ncbi:hypothetical protein MKQ68_19125 [Chitinophaga horti]|uniref:Uncharacterized protein n=1 Tax=Chitinophaga horti TaxID=2920382 RepID=A0ABY6IY57_9BACT|nr:hypothetical protein [Chitinophaga horti]UYQ92203.1 hypothetical protein MKQ68_19125 [Chitinophaga horti]
MKNKILAFFVVVLATGLQFVKADQKKSSGPGTVYAQTSPGVYEALFWPYYPELFCTESYPFPCAFTQPSGDYSIYPNTITYATAVSNFFYASEYNGLYYGE